MPLLFVKIAGEFQAGRRRRCRTAAAVGLIRGGGREAVEEHGRALDVKDATPSSAAGPHLGTRRRSRAAGAGHRTAVWRTRSTTAPA